MIVLVKTNDQIRDNYSGMTINERLFAAGLLKEFDSACVSRDRTKMVELLGRVNLGDQAERIADSVLNKFKCLP
jgi:hypothetical protein